MRTLKAALFTIAISYSIGCGLETASYVSALTGETCEPSPETYMAREVPSNGNVSPTGIPGDNLDDQRSGKVDCLGDGNSGQGDDRKHNCEFPQSGCDDQGCCDSDIVEVPEEEEPDEELPPVVIN